MSRLTKIGKSNVPPVVLKMLGIEDVPTECVEIIKTDSNPCNSVCEQYVCSECPIDEAFVKLAHYEDLEEQGRLIELPCAVGDKVYTIERHCPKPWKKEYCDDARKILREDSCSVCPHRTAYIATHEFDFDDLTYESEIFTTKEEAEEKLAEVEGAE